LNCSEEEKAMTKNMQALARRTGQLPSVDYNSAVENLTMKITQKRKKSSSHPITSSTVLKKKRL
jgi:hypothetical protein